MNEEELRFGLRVLVEDSPELANIRSTVRKRLAQRRKVRRTLLATAAAAAVATVAIVTATLLTGGNDPAERTAAYPENAVPSSSVRCYATADVQTGADYLVVVADNINGGAPVPAGPLAVQLCGGQWAAGVLSSSPPHVRPDLVVNPTSDPGEAGPLSRPVPTLVRCVLPTGMSDHHQLEVATFPGNRSTCSRLSLASYGN